MDLFESSSPEVRLQIEDLCMAVRDLEQGARIEALESLRSMVRSFAEKDISIRDLREEARNLGVQRYSRMDKLELRLAVAARKKVLDERSRANSSEICGNS